MGCFVIVTFLSVPLILFVLLLALLPCWPKRWKQRLLSWCLRMLLPFRYEVRVKGFSSLPKEGGFLFLPNHPAMMDPLILLTFLAKRYRVHAVAAENQVKKSPKAFALFDALPVPDFGSGVNSFQKHLMDTLLNDVVQVLESGASVLLYPAGRLMRSSKSYEEHETTSAVFDILQKRDDNKRPWHVVLVHTHGLWGSRFSYACDEKIQPDFFVQLKRGICDLICSFFLFMPKRKVDIVMEVQQVPDFADKLALNDWLEKFYNQKGEEQLRRPEDKHYERGKGLVPDRCCSNKVREPAANVTVTSATDTDMTDLDPKQVLLVRSKLAKHLSMDMERVGLDQSLSFDLGMDSIQLGELLGWLDDEFDAQDVEVPELLDVASVVRVALGKCSSSSSSSTRMALGRAAPVGWEEARERPALQVNGNNVPEAFIHNAKRMGSYAAVGDDTAGALPYDRVLIGALLFADFLLAHPEKIEGGRVGVMMPAAAGVGVLVMGVMLARCTPVMINWTVGRTSLEHVIKSTGVKAVLTAKTFLKKLGPEVDLSSLFNSGCLVYTEDIKANHYGGFGTLSLIRAKWKSGKSAEKLISSYKLNKIDPKSEAVVLFTSGSESVPKGVPLSHQNILTNVKGLLDVADGRSNDCLFGILPPFHSFGFTVTTVGPLIAGIKVAYYPKPTEYRRIAREVQRWKPSVYLGTPTFVSGMLQAAKADRDKQTENLKRTAQNPAKSSSNKVSPEVDDEQKSAWPTASLRMCFTGAEKTPDDLFKLADSHEPPINIIEGYGITETSPVLTANRLTRPRAGVGWPILQSAVALVDTEAYLAYNLKKVEALRAESPTGDEVSKEMESIAMVEDMKLTGPHGKTGVILASGPNVFGAPDAKPPSAYLGIPLWKKNPYMKLKDTPDRWWYDTGDLGYFDKNGALHLTGRLTRFIKIAGEMISLPALEQALKEKVNDDGSRPWADIEGGPVIAVEAYEAEGQKPVLGVVASVNVSLDDANKQLGIGGQPKIAKLTLLVDSRKEFDERFAEMGTLPLLGTGKTDYASLKKAVIKAANVAKETHLGCIRVD